MAAAVHGQSVGGKFCASQGAGVRDADVPRPHGLIESGGVRENCGAVRDGPPRFAVLGSFEDVAIFISRSGHGKSLRAFGVEIYCDPFDEFYATSRGHAIRTL